MTCVSRAGRPTEPARLDSTTRFVMTGEVSCGLESIGLGRGLVLLG